MGIMGKTEARILVVDDERTVADTLAEYLNRLGYEAVPVYNGIEGLNRFKEAKFQLVITDLVMPEMDGMQFLDAIRRLDRDVSVIVLTGYGTIESAVQAIKGGAYDFITKPFKFEEIELIVERAMEKHLIFRQMRRFRGMFYFLLFTVPLWILLGVLCILAWN